MTESLSGTLLAALVIVDHQGHRWSLTADTVNGNQVAIDGKIDTTTKNTAEILYYGGLIYKLDTSNHWQSKSSPTASWINVAQDPRLPAPAPAPTPIPVTPPPAPPPISPPPAPTPVPVTPPPSPPPSSESPSGTTVTTVGPTITDASGNKYALATDPTLLNQLTVNGVVDQTTNRIEALLYYNHLLYQENLDNDWWYETSPGSGWIATTDPRVAPSPTPVPAPNPNPSGQQSGTRFPYQTATAPAWPFAANSFYNIGLGSGAKWSQAGDALTNAIMSSRPQINMPGGNAYNYPTYTGGASDQLLTSSASSNDWFDQNYSFQIHCPANAQPTPVFTNSDVLMCLFDSTQPMYAEWNNDCVIDRNAGTITGGFVSRWDSQGNGIAATGQGNSLPGIQGQELDQGFINHVLPCSLLPSMLKNWDPNDTQFGTNHFNCVWPAKGSDYMNSNTNYAGPVPFGSIIGIPKSVVDVETLGLSGGALIIARQLQNYGWLVSNQSGTFTTYASWDVFSTTSRTTIINAMDAALKNTLYQYMRVMLSWMVGMNQLQTPSSPPGAGYQYDPIQNPNAPINGGGTYPATAPIWDPSLPSGFVK